MRRLTEIPGNELFESYEEEKIMSYLWEIQKAWAIYIKENREGECLENRFYFFELIWNLISEQHEKHSPFNAKDSQKI